mmetsp:Transcript_3775/g.7744  ORF Transcript_3775/g.7744 Transcript_3775/m.7744 type:complete len:210 (+) Transcript_3775:665-1294(+)
MLLDVPDRQVALLRDSALIGANSRLTHTDCLHILAAPDVQALLLRPTMVLAHPFARWKTAIGAVHPTLAAMDMAGQIGLVGLDHIASDALAQAAPQMLLRRPSCLVIVILGSAIKANVGHIDCGSRSRNRSRRATRDPVVVAAPVLLDIRPRGVVLMGLHSAIEGLRVQGPGRVGRVGRIGRGFLCGRLFLCRLFLCRCRLFLFMGAAQ